MRCIYLPGGSTQDCEGLLEGGIARQAVAEQGFTDNVSEGWRVVEAIQEGEAGYENGEEYSCVEDLRKLILHTGYLTLYQPTQVQHGQLHLLTLVLLPHYTRYPTAFNKPLITYQRSCGNM